MDAIARGHAGPSATASLRRSARRAGQPSAAYSRRVSRALFTPPLVAFALLTGLLTATPAAAASLPSGFTEALVATGLSNPTAMAVAPDGRVYVSQQGGALRVVKNGALLATPFVILTVDSSGERGLLGVAFDPDFTTNNFVYLYYTARTPAVHKRVSRFTANGDVVLAGSEVVFRDVVPRTVTITLSSSPAGLFERRRRRVARGRVAAV